MSARILIEIGAAPAVITESLRCVLVAHGYQVCDARGLVLHSTDLEALLVEAGRNCSQSLLDLDETPADDEDDALDVFHRATFGGAIGTERRR